MKLPNKLKRRFTNWYVRRGYTFHTTPDCDGYWVCPWYVKPLLIFFSPTVYMEKAIGENILVGFQAGIAGWGELIKDYGPIFPKDVLERIKEVNTDA